MPRVLIPQESRRDEAITIRDRKALHYLFHVLRVRVGDRLECFDGAGRSYVARIVRRTRSELTAHVEQCRSEPAPALKVTLAQALIRPDRFEWVIEKATELGVSVIIPIATSRTTIRSAAAVAGSRLLRWRRIAEGACAQCGRATLPLIRELRSFPEVVADLKGQPAVSPTLATDGPPFSAYLQELQGASAVTVFIGPEGDFSPEEVAFATQHGVHPVWLGRLTLRSETAAIVALTLLQRAAGVL